MDNIKKCTPAFVYMVIAGVLLLAMTILALARGSFSLGNILGQALGIFVCTLILVGLCVVTETKTFSWVIVILMAISTLGGLLGTTLR